MSSEVTTVQSEDLPIKDPNAPEPQAQAQAKDTPTAPPEATPPEEQQQEAPPPPPAEEVDLSPYRDKVSRGEELTADDISSLAEKLGAPKEIVELTYEGMKARQAIMTSSLLAEAGGSDAYKEMVDWAATKYSPEEAQKFNQDISSGSLDSARSAIVELKRRFTEVNGSPTAQAQNTKQTPQKQTQAPANQRPAPAGGTSNEVKPYGSFSEQCAAQKDPRYGRDPEYTNMVYRRIAKSNYSK